MTAHVLLFATVAAEDAEAFEAAFAEVNQEVLKIPGCLGGRLLADPSKPGSYLMIGEWESEDAYRSWETYHSTMTAPMRRYWAGRPVVRTIYELRAKDGRLVRADDPSGQR